MNKLVLLKKNKFYVELIITSKLFGWFVCLLIEVDAPCKGHFILNVVYVYLFFFFHLKSNIFRHFGIKCAKCNRNIQTSDWVRRAKDNVYHLACFACENCKRQLSTGEEFALHNNKLLCKIHYCEFIDGDSNGN